jgi:hypothetical protein
MKYSNHPSGAVSTSTRPAGAPSSRDAVFSRIKLAFLDEFVREKRGYDPYDTASHRSTPDIWMAKRKRA